MNKTYNSNYFNLEITNNKSKNGFSTFYNHKTEKKS